MLGLFVRFRSPPNSDMDYRIFRRLGLGIGGRSAEHALWSVGLFHVGSRQCVTATSGGTTDLKITG